MYTVKAGNFKITIFGFFSVCCLFTSARFIWSVEAAAPFCLQDQGVSLSSVTRDFSKHTEVIEEDGEDDLDYWNDDLEEETKEVPDPLAPFNRAMFHLNDKLYFWLLKPVSRAYRAIFAEPARVSISNVFSNLLFPQRFVNCILQANFKGAGNEFSRFVVNTTVGIGGLFDPAGTRFGLKKQEEDFGQTFGTYGIREGVFINWPIFGPSTLRDSVGMIPDYFLKPLNYVKPSETWLTITGYKTVNNTSLKIGDYEALKEAAIDPYLSMRDVYIQYRQKQIIDR